MSKVPPTPAASPGPSSSLNRSKPQRVLACVLCQQRKVKCDRQFPCANCVKSRAQCIPATLISRRRKRRFPERELLDRLRQYEDLLRQHNIKFEPLHKIPFTEKTSSNPEGGYESDEDQPEAQSTSCESPTTTEKRGIYEVNNNFRDAMRQGFRDPDNDDDSSHDSEPMGTKNALDRLFVKHDHLLFGSRQTAVDLSTLHPEPVQIFRLWQIYLDNVNPLLKVTHTPSLQGCIIDVASNQSTISPVLEALIFGIYCMAIRSLSADECSAVFGSSKDDLLTKYQFGCQQALLNCEFLRSNDRDCLTAFYLYLLSVGANADPRALSSMLGLAVRIAQRMGLDNETMCTKHSVLEAEMRRRLWYSLIVFDARIGQLTDQNIPSPDATCQIPLNVNDCDLWPAMKEPPTAHDQPTEAIFVVVRTEVVEFIRHSMFRLDGAGTQNVQQHSVSAGRELVALENMIEDKYLKFCNPDNAIQFLTIWMTRGHLAKLHLVEDYWRYSSQSPPLTEGQRRDAAISHALSMLECDTKIMTSPLTKGYRWLAYFYFLFPAYIHIIQDLRRRPLIEQAQHAWEAMSDNYEARFTCSHGLDGPFSKVFAKTVLQAWEAREEACEQSQSSELLMPPRIVLHLRSKITQNARKLQETPSCDPGPGFALPTEWTGSSLLYHMEGDVNYADTTSGVDLNIFGSAPFDFDVNQIDWGMGQ